MSATQRSLQRGLLVLPVIAALALAIGLAGSPQAAEAGVNYNPTTLVIVNSNAAVSAVASAASPGQLVSAAEQAGASLAGDPANLTTAISDAFSNPNAAGDQAAITSAFITGYFSVTNGQSLNSPNTQTLVSALLQNVPASTVLSAALSASGSSLQSLTPNSSFCAFLAGVGGSAGTSLQAAAASQSPDPYAVCGLTA